MTRPDVEKVLPYLKLPVRLSPTRVELGRRCQRRHVLSDLLHLSNPDQPSPSLGFGTVNHAAVAEFWRWATDDDGYETGDRIEALRRAKQVMTDEWPDDMPPDTYMTPELGGTLLDQYAKNARLGADLPGTWRIVELEERQEAVVNVEGVGPVEIGYTVDRRMESDEGDVAIVDTKTASKLSPMWRDGMTSSVQQRLYHWLESERLGRDVDYLVIEGVQKKVTPGLIEYVWADMQWTPEYVEETRRLLAAQARRDADFLQALADADVRDGELYQHALNVALTEPEVVDFNLMDCRSYYVECDFFELCHGCPTEREGLARAELDMDYYEY